MKNDNSNNKSRPLKIKEGIAKARTFRCKRGRPPITESKHDPDLPFKATEMRLYGFSWSQIASNLNVGRTTARQLVSMCLKDE